MAMKIVIDHVHPEDEMSVIKEIRKLAAARMIQFRIAYTEEQQPNFSEPLKRNRGYIGGIRDKGISLQDLALKAILEYGPIDTEEMKMVLEDNKFAPSGTHAIMSKMKNQKLVKRGDDNKWIITEEGRNIIKQWGGDVINFNIEREKGEVK